MDMSGCFLAIVTVIVTVAWIVMGETVVKESKPYRSPKEDWHPSWRNKMEDE